MLTQSQELISDSHWGTVIAYLMCTLAYTAITLATKGKLVAGVKEDSLRKTYMLYDDKILEKAN